MEIYEKPKPCSPFSKVKYSARRLFIQVKILLWKNYLLFTRQLLSTLILILSPIMVCFFLWLITYLITEYIEQEININPDINEITKIPKCNEKNCVTLGIGLTGGNSEWSEYVISHISEKHELRLGKDIKIYSENSYFEFTDYVKNHANTTQAGLILCTKDYVLPNNTYLSEIPCGSSGKFSNYLYLIMYNLTESPMNSFDRNAPDPLDKIVISVKLAVDDAILAYLASKNKLPIPSIELAIQSFPRTENRLIKGYDSVSLMGPMFFFIPPLLIFGMISSEIVKEKELRLRHGLSVMGVSSTAFWISWFLTGLSISFLSTNCLIVSGYLFKFDFFLNSPYVIQLLNFQAFAMTMLMLGFWLSTLLKSAKLAYTMSYTFLLFGIVLQSFLQSQLLMILSHVINLPWWVGWILWGFSFYPGYNFSVIYSDIATKAASHPNHSERRWEAGTEYTLADFYSPRAGYIRGYEYYIDPAIYSLYDQLFNFCLFMLFAWFFDHILPSNRGKADPVYFVLTKDFWGCRRKKRLSEIEMVNITGSDMAISEDYSTSDGLRIESISKVYKKHCWSGEEDIHAVKNISLNVEKDELLAIIGHNGAGKTTLLSMLTGLLSPTSGTAHISNYDITHDMNKIYNVMGYCPQYNILWDELTGYEHLWMFCVIKNISSQVRHDYVIEKIKEVDLLDSKDQLVGKYSGGMKRRLSVAISGIGNPSIIFMDEPTTGMDPISRRFVWKLIQRMKQDRVLILTTHDMEEADVLADKIAVMVDGRVKCIGNSLHLKNNYGEGYKVELFSKDTVKLWDLITQKISSARVIDNSGGSLVISIPKSESAEALKLYKLIESDDSIQRLVENWGLSNSSLEEVFMRVTEKIHHYK